MRAYRGLAHVLIFFFFLFFLLCSLCLLKLRCLRRFYLSAKPTGQDCWCRVKGAHQFSFGEVSPTTAAVFSSDYRAASPFTSADIKQKKFITSLLFGPFQ